MTYLILLGAFFILMLIYFRVANHYNIIDKPNERSSHTEITTRGGGVIFLFSLIAVAVMHPAYWLPVSGAVIIGLISFLDDILTLTSRIRVLFHLFAVSIGFYYLGIYTSFPIYFVVLLYIMAIGVINVYNFMDGINGITGTYSLVVLLGLQYVNLYKTAFIDADAIWLPILACLVFLFFNFRKKARCFAGDVGSVTIAFWIVLLLLKVIFATHSWAYILFLAVYGVDSVLTIIHRLILKQNILKAHRLHLYQLMVNEGKSNHLLTSTCYALIQLIISSFVVLNKDLPALTLSCIVLFPLIFAYLIIKFWLIKINKIALR